MTELQRWARECGIALIRAGARECLNMCNVVHSNPSELAVAELCGALRCAAAIRRGQPVASALDVLSDEGLDLRTFLLEKAS